MAFKLAPTCRIVISPSLPVANPALKIAAMNESQDQNDALVVDQVEHDAVVSCSQPHERIPRPADLLHPLAAKLAPFRGLLGHGIETRPETRSDLWREFLE